MRLAFMGTPDFAVPTLDALAESHEIAAVYTQPPRPAGRGKKPRPSPVQARAEALGLPVRSPLNFRDPADRDAFAALDLDAAVVVAYGLILPEPILRAPRLGCLNLHGSLLPRWRGAAPIQRAIMAGDAETGLCAMVMERGLDTGPVLLDLRTSIGPRETAGALTARLAQMGGELMLEALEGFAADRLTPRAQPEEGALYATKIDKDEARIDWTRDAEALDRQIRGLSPAPGAWTSLNGERLKVLLATPEAGAGRPGEALDDALLIACGRGALRIQTAQRPGRAVMDRETLLRGFSAPKGSMLGCDDEGETR
ncbi:MAG: methionyl-tRNA formyltransferase [Rubrimonas sp.]|uniref:methionyl-tRNA formyltransferase n=1 Tax=Rubrimonas sp. TaxID=2036015 RepID=UPI002FDDE53A